MFLLVETNWTTSLVEQNHKYKSLGMGVVAVALGVGGRGGGGSGGIDGGDDSSGGQWQQNMSRLDP